MDRAQGTDVDADAAAVALIGIDFYCFDDFLFFITVHGYTSFFFSAEMPLAGVSLASVRIPLLTKSSLT